MPPTLPIDMDVALEGAVRHEGILKRVTEGLLQGILPAIDRHTRAVEEQTRVARAATADQRMIEILQKCVPNMERFQYLVRAYNALNKEARLTEKMRAIVEEAIIISAPEHLKSAGYEWLRTHLDTNPHFINLRQAILSFGPDSEPLWEEMENGATLTGVTEIISKTKMPPNATRQETIAKVLHLLRGAP